jgi:anti-sigma regulatory factor (Ser/Thr protein kinase)
VTKLIHRALLYDRDRSFVESAVPFLIEGLVAGDAVLAVGPATGVNDLRRELGGSAGAVEFHDAAQWYSQPTRTIAAYSTFIAQHPGARLRVIAEPDWRSRTQAEMSEWTRYESIVNQAFAEIEASVLCLYDQRTTADGVLDGALRTHPELFGDAGPRPNGFYQDPPAVYAKLDEQPLPPLSPHAFAMPLDDLDLHALRSFIGGHAEDHGMASARRHELLLATTEVATNALRHGAPPVTCRIWAEADDLVVDVTDGGQWSPGTAPGFLPPDPADGSGFGLWGVRMLCPLVQIRTSVAGTTVRLRVPLT